MIRMRLRFRFWWRRRRAAIAFPPAAPAGTVDHADLPLGPGWFDSSWDLKCGLDVSEGLPADASVNEWLMELPGPVTPPEPMTGPPGPTRGQQPALALVQGQGRRAPQGGLSPA
jgi:hypothetical protein